MCSLRALCACALALLHIASSLSCAQIDTNPAERERLLRCALACYWLFFSVPTPHARCLLSLMAHSLGAHCSASTQTSRTWWHAIVSRAGCNQRGAVFSPLGLRLVPLRLCQRRCHAEFVCCLSVFCRSAPRCLRCWLSRGIGDGGYKMNEYFEKVCSWAVPQAQFVSFLCALSRYFQVIDLCVPVCITGILRRVPGW